MSVRITRKKVTEHASLEENYYLKLVQKAFKSILKDILPFFPLLFY